MHVTALPGESVDADQTAMGATRQNRKEGQEDTSRPPNYGVLCWLRVRVKRIS